MPNNSDFQNKELLLFVGEGVNRIFLSGFEGRINGPHHGSQDGNNGGFHHPANGEVHAQGRELVMEPRQRCQAHQDADDNSGDGEQQGFPQDHADDVRLGSAQRFEYPDLTRALHDRGVHGLEDHDEADDDRYSHHYFDKRRESGDVFGRHQAQPLAHGHDVEFFEYHGVLEFLDRGLGMVRIVELHIEHGNFFLAAGSEVLHGTDRDKAPPTAPVLHYARHPELMVQYFDGRAGVNVIGAGKVIIHQHVVGALHGGALKITERSSHGLE